jgi:hypothetical protein
MNELCSIRVWLCDEMLLLLAALRSRGLLASLAVALALWSLAYQIPASHTLHVGGDQTTRLRHYDRPFLIGFNDPEPDPPAPQEWYDLPEAPYRWTKGEAEVLFPGLGGGMWGLRLSASAGARPQPVPIRVQIGAAPPVTLSLAPGPPRTFHLIGPATHGDLTFRLSAPPFTPLDDTRTLGVVVVRVVAAPVVSSLPVWPAPATLALLAATLIGLFALLARLTSTLHSPLRHAPTVAALAFALLTAYLLAVQRIDITVFIPVLAGVTWSCWLLAVLLVPLLNAAARSMVLAERSGAVGLVVAAFGVRMAGMLHPYARFSDTGLHANNLTEVALRGMLLLTEGLPCRAGGGQSPYPPGAYLTLAPGLLLAGDSPQTRLWLLQGGVALAESASAAVIWLLLRWAGLGPRAALLGGALYVAAPPLLRSFSVGEMANLFAHGLVAPLLLLLTLVGLNTKARRHEDTKTSGGWSKLAPLLAAVVLVILLSHTGVALSTAALLATWLPLHMLVRRGAAQGLLRIVGGLAASGLIAGLLFYSAYLGLFAERRALASAQASLPAAERCPVGYPLTDKLNGWVVQQIVGPQPAVPPLLALAGATGTLLLLITGGRQKQAIPRPSSLVPPPSSLGLLLAACWLGGVLSLATLLSSDQALRWQHFLYPALCLGGAIAFAAWARRGAAGRVLAAAALAALLWYGLSDWVRQVSRYLH